MDVSRAVREAHDARDWIRVLEILESADSPNELEAQDRLSKAESLYWTGRFDEAVNEFESLTAFAESDRPAEAGLIASRLV